VLGVRDAPHRACLGGSWDLSTTEPQRPPLLPTELASVEARICELQSGVPEGRGKCGLGRACG
jgi:hypothetical protein